MWYFYRYQPRTLEQFAVLLIIQSFSVFGHDAVSTTLTVPSRNNLSYLLSYLYIFGHIPGYCCCCCCFYWHHCYFYCFLTCQLFQSYYKFPKSSFVNCWSEIFYNWMMAAQHVNQPASLKYFISPAVHQPHCCWTIFLSIFAMQRWCGEDLAVRSSDWYHCDWRSATVLLNTEGESAKVEWRRYFLLYATILWVPKLIFHACKTAINDRNR